MTDKSAMPEDPTTPINLSPNKLTMAGMSSSMMRVISAVAVVVIGAGLGYFVATKSPASSSTTTGTQKVTNADGKVVDVQLKQEDLRDTGQGTIKPKPDKDKYIPGSHILQRDDSPWPIYLISAIVDLSAYENKHVKVYGVTYGCEKGKWCLEVNKVENK